MAREVKNAHYRRTGTSKLWRQPGILTKHNTLHIEWVTRVVRPSSSFKMSESDSNSERSYDSDDSEYNLSLATSTLAILKLKTMEN